MSEVSEAVPLTGERALFIPRLGLLAVGDLHIGYDLGWEEAGVRVPRGEGVMAERLDSLLQRTRARRLLLNGDVVDPLFQKGRLVRRVAEFFDRIGTKEVDLVKGNHDSGIEEILPEWVRVHPAGGVRIEDVGFCHGHAAPSKELLGSRILVMSHSHPAVALESSSVGGWRNEICWLRWRKAESATSAKEKRPKVVGKRMADHASSPAHSILEAIVMPPFNPIMAGGGVNLRHRRVAPAFRLLGIPIGEAEVWLLDGTHLGRIGDLPVIDAGRRYGAGRPLRGKHPSARYTSRKRRPASAASQAKR